MHRSVLDMLHVGHEREVNVIAEVSSLPDSRRSALMAASMGPGSSHSLPLILMYHLIQQSLHPSTAILPSHATLQWGGQGRGGEGRGGRGLLQQH